MKLVDNDSESGIKFLITKIMCLCKGLVNCATVFWLTQYSNTEKILKYIWETKSNHLGFEITKEVIVSDFQAFIYHERKATFEINNWVKS